MAVVSMKQLLEAGVHFGHQTRRWNPKMAPYITPSGTACAKIVQTYEISATFATRKTPKRQQNGYYKR